MCVVVVEVLGERMFQAKAQRTHRRAVLESCRSFEKEQEANWGQNKVCKGSWEDLLALPWGPKSSFPGGVRCVGVCVLFHLYHRT